jgi:hypothetical protein
VGYAPWGGIKLMFRSLLQAFTSPAAGPVGFALAFLMCGLLIATTLEAQRSEAGLRSQVAALTAVNERNGIALHARLAACEGGPTDVARTRAANAMLSPEQRPPTDPRASTSARGWRARTARCSRP